MLRQVTTALALALIATGVRAQVYATGDPRPILTPPTYPRICQVLRAQFSTAVRATPPAADDTARIQEALDDCADSGMSVVLVPSRTGNAFYSGKLTVTGEGLVVAAGATLEGNDSYASQPELIYVTGRDAFIGGEGAIDGRGDLITAGKPRLIEASDTEGLTVYEITLQQGAHPHLYMEGGSRALVYGITILTPYNRKNADGIDIDSMHDVSIIDSSIEAGDDGVAVKTNSGPAYDITVRNNRLYGTHGLSIGSQTFEGVTNVLFRDNYVYGLDHGGNYSTDDNAIRIKTDPTCGGIVQRVTYANTCITQAKHLIVVTAYYGACSGTPGTPQFKDIVINGVNAINSQSGAYSRIQGYDTDHLAQIFLANVSVDATAQSGDENASVKLDNSNVVPSGPNVTTGSFSTFGSVPVCAF
jgi:polygalacturonase